MQKLSYILSKYYWVAIVIIVALSFYHCGRQDVKEKIVEKERVVYKDSVKTIIKEIKGKEKEIVKYVDRVKYLKENTPTYPKECDSIVKWKDSIINNQDTIIQYKDSIIYLDRKVIEYKDRLLDLPKTRKRLGLGIQAGYGIDNRPYVGLGLSYNLFVF